MEKGRRFDSGDEFRERRKKGGLPLAVFLSFNDRGVHPHCPNASNPYHKCGRHCLDKIPSLNEVLDGERSVGSSTESVKLERKVVTPNCPNAFNPYHKCAEYCFEKITLEDVVKEPVHINDEEKVHKKSVTPIALNALNSFHTCTECFSGSPTSSQRVKPKEQKNIHIADRGIGPYCKYAANPYHICAEYCFQEVPASNKPGQGMELKSPKEAKKMVKEAKIASVNPHCRYASNPYHKCAEYCFQKVEERDKSDRALVKEKRGDPEKGRKADHPTKEKSSIEASNTGHNHTDPSKGISINVGAIESNSVFVKEEKDEDSMLEIMDTQPLRIDASDLFKEWAKYCSLKAIEEEANKG